jgi:hypothetical protein
MIERQDIITEIEKELDDLLAAAPEDLSEKARKAIKEESIAHTKHVLDALTIQELQSAGAYNRFLESTLAEARMRKHLR